MDPAFSFALGWNYWYNWTIGLPAELSAAAVLMQFWKSVGFLSTPFRTGSFLRRILKQPDDVNPAVWITMCFVVVILINVFGVGDWLSS